MTKEMAINILRGAVLGTNEQKHEAVFMAIKALKEQERVDAVEVVLCKECKKYIPCQKLPIGTSKWCDLFDRATCEMNYCGWGERREDGRTGME